jgi:hypothetical protein
VIASVLSAIKWSGIVVGGLILVLIAGFVLVPLATRRWTDRWGATPEEVAALLPGDDLFPAQREVSTKAITIDAPPDVVYALIQQMGQHRAGWYGWDWFYDLTGSSGFVDGAYSRRIVPELQNVVVGDRIHINDMVAYEVVQAERGAAFVLAAGSLTREELASGALPAAWSENSMAWVLRPEGERGTRLILRMRADGAERGFMRWLWNRPLNFGGALFSHKTMVGIKRTAEALVR